MLSSSIRLKSLLVPPAGIRLLAANYSRFKQKDNPYIRMGKKREGNLMPVNMSGAEQVQMMKRVAGKGVLFSPKNLSMFVDATPGLGLVELIDLFEMSILLRCKDSFLVINLMKVIASFKNDITVEHATKVWSLLQTCEIPISELMYSLMLGVFKFCNATDEIYTVAQQCIKEHAINPDVFVSMVHFLNVQGKQQQSLELFLNAAKTGQANSNLPYGIINTAATNDVHEGIGMFFTTIDSKVPIDYSIVSMVLFHVFTRMSEVERAPILGKLAQCVDKLQFKTAQVMWEILAMYIDSNMISSIPAFIRDWIVHLKQPLPTVQQVDHNMRTYLRKEREEWKQVCLGIVEIHKALLAHGYKADLGYYMILLGIYNRLEDTTAAIGTLTEMINDKCVTQGAFVSVLSTLAKTKSTEVGKSLYYVARSAGMVNSQQLYQTALQLAVTGDLQWARKIFEEARSTLPTLSLQFFNTMITALAEANELDEAVTLLAELQNNKKAKRNPHPDAASYSPVIIAYLSGGDEQSAIRYLRTAQSSEVQFTPEQTKAITTSFASRPFASGFNPFVAKKETRNTFGGYSSQNSPAATSTKPPTPQPPATPQNNFAASISNVQPADPSHTVTPVPSTPTEDTSAPTPTLPPTAFRSVGNKKKRSEAAIAAKAQQNQQNQQAHEPQQASNSNFIPPAPQHSDQYPSHPQSTHFQSSDNYQPPQHSDQYPPQQPSHYQTPNNYQPQPPYHQAMDQHTYQPQPPYQPYPPQQSPYQPEYNTNFYNTPQYHQQPYQFQSQPPPPYQPYQPQYEQQPPQYQQHEYQQYQQPEFSQINYQPPPTQQVYYPPTSSPPPSNFQNYIQDVRYTGSPNVY